MIATTKNIPAVAYLRRSTDRQEQSLGDQRLEVSRYAEEHGYQVIREYVDDAISGTSADERPGFQAMVADAQAGGFQAVIVWNSDRFSRGDVTETEHYRYLLRQANVKVLSVTEDYLDRDGIDGDVLRTVKQFQNRQYVISLSQNTLRGQISAVMAESDPGRAAPYGYDREILAPDGSVLFRIRFCPGRVREMYDKDGKLQATYAKGQSLSKPGKECKARLVLSDDDRVQVIKDIFAMCLDGVGFAHSKGVIHQDLKPHNIQVTPAGEALLVDFGVACLVGERKEGRSKAIGTPAYMSPEQVEGRYVDSRTDIYSLGMSLYQLVTAHHPFEDAQDLDQILGWQSSRDPLPPSYFIPNMPRGLENAIMRAVAKSARDRFRNCREFAEALGVALDQETSAINPEDVRWDPRADIVVPARVRITGGTEFQPARTVDLSAGGAAMRMRQPPPPSTPIVVEIYLPAAAENEPSVVTADAVIVWVSGEKGRDTVGAGVRFTKLSDVDRERIGAVVREALVLGGESSLFGSTTPQAPS